MQMEWCVLRVSQTHRILFASLRIHGINRTYEMQAILEYMPISKIILYSNFFSVKLVYTIIEVESPYNHIQRYFW